VLSILSSVNDVAFRLGFLSTAELEETTPAPWVTQAELYTWADEAVKRLAYEAGMFVVVDSSVQVIPFSGVLNLPLTHVFTLLAAYLTNGGGTVGSGEAWGTLPWGTVPWGGGTLYVAAGPLVYGLLRLTSVRDLYALDGTWPVTTGTPKRASLDAGSVGTITLYPIPTAAGVLFQVCQEYPTVSQVQPLISLPTVLQDYLTYYMLWGAREKESEMRQPEMADHYKQRTALYEQLIQGYWGPGM
jgi:hypothetical protein